jgi:hypothetical protein
MRATHGSSCSTSVLREVYEALQSVVSPNERMEPASLLPPHFCGGKWTGPTAEHSSSRSLGLVRHLHVS